MTGASMEQRRSALGELWAWLIGLVLPAGALAGALAFTVSGEPPGSADPAAPTTLVAGASAQSQAPVAPTATPRDSMSQTVLIAAPVPEARSGVAGVQDQSAFPPITPITPVTPMTPLLGTVGAGPVPFVAPALTLTLAVAGFAWRVHTSAPWPSRNRPHRRPALPS
jgi:hypothetical protein